MPNVFMKAFFVHPDQEFAWAEKFYLTAASDLPSAVTTAQPILEALCQLKAKGVTLRYAYVSADGVFRDRLYLENPGLTKLSDGSFIFNTDLGVDGSPAAPEVSALISYNNQNGTAHGRMFMRGLADSYFLSYPDTTFSPSGGWQSAFGRFKRAIGATGSDGGAKLSFSHIDVTAARNPILTCTNLANLVTIGFQAPGFDAGNFDIYIGRTKGTGININGVWHPGQYLQPNALTVTIQLQAPGFTWKNGGYVMKHTNLLAAVASIYPTLSYYTAHDTGAGFPRHKGRRKRRNPQFIQ